MPWRGRWTVHGAPRRDCGLVVRAVIVAKVNMASAEGFVGAHDGMRDVLACVCDCPADCRPVAACPRLACDIIIGLGGDVDFR